MKETLEFSKRSVALNDEILTGNELHCEATINQPFNEILQKYWQHLLSPFDNSSRLPVSEKK